MCGVLSIFDAGVAEPLKKVSLYIVAIENAVLHRWSTAFL
jgi:hypothetical protein